MNNKQTQQFPKYVVPIALIVFFLFATLVLFEGRFARKEQAAISFTATTDNAHLPSLKKAENHHGIAAPLFITPIQGVRKLLSESEEKADPTSSAQNETTSKPKNTNVKIRQISLIGERNSGTTWTSAHLRRCFGNDILVRDRLVRYKHWFQHDVVEDKRRHNTLVIAQFRNPYQWVEAMKTKPHHAPMHNTGDWRSFVTRPWTMPRTDKDLEILRRNGTVHSEDPGSLDGSEIRCKAYFNYNQINSCLNHPFPETEGRYEGYFNEGEEPGFSGYKPSYELRNDGSGAPYGSIVELRADKIRNFLDIAEWNWVEAVKIVRYEDLVKNGTEFLIKYIEEMTGLQAKCDAFPPQNRSTRSLPPTFVQWMNQYVDWEAEKLIGYKPEAAIENKIAT